MTMKQYNPEEVARFENETWSRCADNYMYGFGALVKEGVAPLLNAVNVDSGDRVLDLGTGPGLAAGAAAERGADVVAVDFSKPMLAEARRRYPEIEYHWAPAEALPFEDADFDVAIGNFVLHHSGRPQAVLEETYRVLRDNGRMAFTIWADPAKLAAFGLFFAAVEEHAGAAELPHGPLFGVSDFTVIHDMVRKAGFRNSSVRELEIAWRTPSLEPYLTAFREWANLETFPENVRKEIEATVRERATAFQTNGVFAMPNPAILISAGK
jgi:ubiquinone/menaquinone biosynthesis C-methylase UbiE